MRNRQLLEYLLEVNLAHSLAFYRNGENPPNTEIEEAYASVDASKKRLDAESKLLNRDAFVCRV